MKFKYRCGAPSGEIIEDYIESENEQRARELLEEKNYFIFEIKREKKEFSLLKNNGKKELIPFTKMFYVLLKSGMEIINILEVLADQIDNENFKTAVKEIIKDVRSGESLADSMRKKERYFTDFYCSAVEAGEKTGALTMTFDRLYNYLKTQEKIKSKIRLAMIYPGFLTTFAVVVVLFLSLYVLPSFSKIYTSFGKQVPAVTQIVLNISEFIKSFWYIILLGGAGGIFGLKKYLKKEENKHKFDKMLLKLGKLSDFLNKKEITTIFRTLSLSISSGMDIIKSLGIARDTITNSVIKKDFEKVIESITHGEKLSTALKNLNIPKMARQMIAAGEESNNLEEMLDNVSEFYEEEMENTIAGMLGFIEPMLILVVGGVIGFIIVAMLLPILTLSTALS